MRHVSPRVARALELWATGATKSKAQAERIYGLHQGALSCALYNPYAVKYVNDLQSGYQEKTISTAALIEKLSRRGIEVIGDLMEDAQKEDIRLRAAIDLADRGKETAKTQKLQIDNFTVSGRDVAALAEAMISAAKLKEVYAEAATGNFIRAGGVEGGGESPVP